MGELISAFFYVALWSVIIYCMYSFGFFIVHLI